MGKVRVLTGIDWHYHGIRIIISLGFNKQPLDSLCNTLVTICLRDFCLALRNDLSS